MKLRKELVGTQRVVVKVGSKVITKKDGSIDNRKVRKIVEDISDLIDNKIEVILVSSGAVSLGKAFLKKHIPREGRIDLQHSASAVGQPKLINTYSTIFEENGKVCSQILLTHSDFRNRKRHLHTKQNIEVLLKNKITPILNENDSISYNEITVGDNDHLAAQTAQLVNADLLLMITSTNGLYTKSPENEDAEHIDYFEFGRDLSHFCFQGKTDVGRGGMESKIMAISKITPMGIKAIISSKDEDKIIIDALTNNIGTYFAPKSSFNPEQRKAWLISTKKPNCYVDVDRGAFEAIMQSNSLLPKGVVGVRGKFFKGDCVEVRCDGEVFATGICEYSHCEINQIKGMHSDKIEGVLGFRTSIEVIQTINMVIDKELNYEKISS